jgi:hypothetical protein
MTLSDSQLAARLLGSITSAKKKKASRENAKRASEALHLQNSRPFRKRQIMRIERTADRNAYYEVLSCGHRGKLAEGPNRQHIPLKGEVNERRCYQCSSPADQMSKRIGNLVIIRARVG